MGIKAGVGGEVMEPKVYDFDPRNLPAKFLQEIGLIVACSVQTENIVEDAIADLLRLRLIPAKILTTHMSMQIRTGVLRSAAQHCWADKETLAQFDVAIQRIEAAISERNRIAHITWLRDPDTGETFTSKTKARNGLKMNLEPVTPEFLHKIALEIYDAGVALLQFLRFRGIQPVQG